MKLVRRPIEPMARDERVVITSEEEALEALADTDATTG